MILKSNKSNGRQWNATSMVERCLKATLSDGPALLQRRTEENGHDVGDGFK